MLIRMAAHFPSNPLLQLVPARIPQAITRVRELVWSPVSLIPDIASGEPSASHVGIAAARRLPLRPVKRFPQHYGHLWDQRWFRLRLPAGLPKEELFLQWVDQAEATLYLKDLPFYGFDIAHRHAPLPAGTREVWIESVVSHTGIWHPDSRGLDPEGSRLEGARLFRRNELAWGVLHDFLVLDELMREELRAAFPTAEIEFAVTGKKPEIEVVPPLLRRLLRFLDDAMNALDSSGLPAAKKSLALAFSNLPGRGEIPSAILTGHAHIDLVWLWPERVGEFKVVHTFATANRLLERYPEMRFAYSQPASYEAVRRISPGIFRAAQKRMREGRWEAHGATQVESDTLLPCGEALVRSFLVGQKGFEEITGNRSPILWLPDVFGYSGCLPQLMRETGAQYFFTTKLTWNAITPFPHSSFVWAGADGSEVIAHICQNNVYNQAVSVAELRRGAAAHRQCDVHPEFLAPTGYGDGGGGVTEEMCERARRAASLTGVPATAWGTLDGFFGKLAKLQDRLPVYRGELYLEFHRGTYTTHGDIKAAMRAAERALQTLEAARCATGRDALDTADWKRVIFAQFHDFIPGSSIHEVYDEGKPELAKIADSSLGAAREVLGGSVSCGPAVFNPLPHPRIHISGKHSYIVLPLSGAPLTALPEAEFPPVLADKTSLSNGRVKAVFDTFGRIRALQVDGRAVAFSGPANEFVLFPEHPHSFPAWEIDRQSLSLGRADVRKAEVKAGGREVVFMRPLGERSRVAVRYSLDPGSPVLRIGYDIEWREECALLKAVFPTLYLGRDARFGAPFGSVRRPQLGGNLSAEAMWEVPASRWAQVSDDSESEGFFMATEAKFGFSCRDGALGLSLVRSAKIPSEDRGHFPGSHPEPIRRTLSPHLVSDIGRHRIEIAIGRFDPAAPREEHPAALAEILFTPMLEYRGPARECGLLGLSGGDSLQPVWAIPVAKDRWILRLHETLGRSGTAKLHLTKGWNARRVDLMGNPLAPLPPSCKIIFTPYKVLSIEVLRS